MDKNLPFLARLRFALAGVREAWRGERSFRAQCLVAAGVALFLLIKRPAPVWWALVILCCGAVLAAELFNTALERALDALHPAHHPAVKAAKDCAAGAVLVLACASACLFAFLLLD